MSVSIRQIHPVFVGEVSGIDIARPLSRDEVAAIEAGMDRHAVLVFHDQRGQLRVREEDLESFLEKQRIDAAAHDGEQEASDEPPK